MPKCLLCDKMTSRAGLHWHLFSATHMPYWSERIRKSRKHFTEWIEAYDAGKKPQIPLLPSFPQSDKSSKRYRICFGCKKLDTGKKTHTCESAECVKVCVEVYRNILSSEVEVIVEEDKEAPTSDEMKKLQKKVDELEKIAEVNEDRLEKAETYRYALKAVLEQFSHHQEAYDSAIACLEEDYPELKGDVFP